MNTIDIIQNTEKQLQKLKERMDSDEKFLTDKYQMRRLDQPNVYVDNVVNVTMNYPGTYANDLATLISQAQVQCLIEGFKNGKPMSDSETDLIETYLGLKYEEIDDQLNGGGLPPLMVWVANHIVVRGWIGGRYLGWEDKAKHYQTLALWDCRYATWEFGAGNLNWAAYKTWRYAEDINKDYPEAKAHGSELIEVNCYYDDTKEEVLVEDRQVKLWKHNRGYVPAIIQPAPAGFLLRGKNYIEHEGESALFLDRLLFNELNRAVSIEQTLGMKAILPAYSQEKQDPNSPADPYPDKPGAQTAYNPGEKPELLPVGDFNTAAQLGRRDIFEGLQQGGRNIDIGNINQPFSAIAIANIEDIRKKALLPRFNAIGSFLKKLSKMMITERQILKIGGEQLKHKKFSPEDFEGDYTIKYRFMSKSKEIDLMNLAQANAAKAMGLPSDVIIRDILQAENPTDIIAKMDAEKGELLDPVVGLLRLAHSSIDEAEDLPEERADAKLMESQMFTMRAYEIIIQRANPQTQEGNQPSTEPESPDVRGNTNMLLPLIGNTGGLNDKGQKGGV